MRMLFIRTGYSKGNKWKLYKDKTFVVGGNGWLIGFCVGCFFLEMEMLP